MSFIKLLTNYKAIKYCLVVGFFLSSCAAFTQSNFIIAPVLGGNRSESIAGCLEIEEGYLCLIRSSSSSPNIYHLNLVKFNNNGIIDTIYNIYSDARHYYRSRPCSLIRLPNGNLLVFGIYIDLETEIERSFLLEINEFGEKINYVESAGTDYRQHHYDAIIDSAGIKVLCIDLDSNQIHSDIKIEEYDFMFNKLNEATFSRNNSQAESLFVPLKDGGYAIAGIYGRTLRIDNYIMGINADLTERWYKLSISNASEARMEQPGIAELKNGDILYCSGLQKNSSVDVSKYVRRMNPLDGETIWEKHYSNGFSHSSFTSTIVVKGENEIYLPGYSEVPEMDNQTRPFFRYPTLTKMNEQGEIIWERLYYTEKYRQGYSYYMQSTKDGGFLISGTAYPNAQRIQSSLIIKTDSLGCIVPGCDSLGMVSSTIEVNSPQGTFSYGPNPVVDDISINYSLLHQSADYSLQLIDGQGKLVRKLPLAAYTSEGHVIWGMTELPAGTYILTLSYRNTIQATAKILKD
jgi:hypothetical protein